MSTLHLHKLLDPESIVLVGASAREGSVGRAVADNLLSGGFAGRLHFVNPRYREVLGQPCHKNLSSVPETPDLALLLVPARLLRRSLVRCARRGIRVAVVMSGAASPRALHGWARRLGLRILGPHCAGLVRPHIGLDASWSVNRVEPGPLAVISQSASLGAALLDWAESSGVGFSALVATGGDTDIRLADLLDLLAEDARTEAIVVYVDRVREPRALLSAASAAARRKPVVMMRSTQDGAPWCDALARNGRVHSSEAVFAAAFRRAGLVRIRTFSNLFAAARTLGSGARTRGRRLAVISNGAAPAMLACERIETKGFRSPRLDATRLEALAEALGPRFSGTNPFVLRDVDALAAQYGAALAALDDPDAFDAVLVIHVPDSRNDPKAIARAVVAARPSRLSTLVCWMGDASVGGAREIFAAAAIPSFRTPEAATDAFDFLHRHHVARQQLLQLPNPLSRRTRIDLAGALELVADELAAGSRVLDPDSTRRLLRLFDIDMLPGRVARDVDEAVAIAREVGWPVVMKLVSPDIAYKASVAPTALHLDDEGDVRAAWREIEAALAERRPGARFAGILVERMHPPGNHRSLAIAIHRDATFGPVLSLGPGDALTAFGRRTVQLPPLNDFLVAEMLDTEPLRTYLGAFRHGSAIDPAPLHAVLRRLSEMACELPALLSLDIDPLRLTADGAVAMNAQVVLEGPRATRRYGHLAIHPYPRQWVRDARLADGRIVRLRPIRPEDGAPLAAMVRGMSPESRYYRFMHRLNELSPTMIARFTKLDYDRQIAFVAVPIGEETRVVGVSRYAMDGARQGGEFAVAVADDWQRLGLASALLRLLVEHAESQGLARLHGDVLRENEPMRALMTRLGFSAETDPERAEVLLYAREIGPEEREGSEADT